MLRDEALGVIERVPYGEPVNWCHRMVITKNMVVRHGAQWICHH